MSRLGCLLHGVASRFSNLQSLEATRALTSGSGFVVWGAVSTPFGNTSDHTGPSLLCASLIPKTKRGRDWHVRTWLGHSHGCVSCSGQCGHSSPTEDDRKETKKESGLP